MKKKPPALPAKFQDNGAGVNAIVAGFAERGKIVLVVRSVVFPVDDVVHMKPPVSGFAFAVPARVLVTVKDVGLGILKAEVRAFLVERLVN